ncbi:MAG: DUF2723 domain-containing protein [Myxococcota bacterium]
MTPDPVAAAPPRVPAIAWSLTTGLAVTTICAVLAQPAPGAGDQAELAAVAWSWGVAHPTGYPLWTLLAHLWVVALGGVDPATAVACLSAVFAGIAAALTVEVGAAFGSRAAGVVAALLFALSPVAWQQATQVEVYPLFFVFQAAEVLALQRALIARDDRGVRRALLAAAVIGGFGATHHLLIGLLVPAALLVVWVRRAALRPRDLLGLVGLAGAPLALYALLPWRASTGPAVSWHRVTTFDKLLDHAMGRQYHGILVLEKDAGWGPILTAIGGPVALALLSGLALVALVRMRPRGSALVLVAYLVAGGVFALNYPVVDQEVFFLPFVWALCLAAALGARVVSARMPVAGLLLLGLPLVQLTNVARLAPAMASHDAALAMLQVAPRGAVAYLAAQDGFTLFYPLLVRGLRPDVEGVDPVLDVRPRYAPYVDRLLGEALPEGRTPTVWVLETLLATGLPIVVHPKDPVGSLDEAKAARVRAGVIDFLVPAGAAPGSPGPACGEVRFVGAVLGLPCAPAADVGPLAVVAAPLTWTSADPAGLELIVVDAAAGEALQGGGARPVLGAPVGMGRPVATLPTDRAWVDALWAAVPRDTPAGPRGLWIALRRGGAWVPLDVAGEAPTQGPFVRLLAYTVRDVAAPPLWTFPD